MTDERPLCFPCAGETLVGMLHPGAAGARRGLLILVGGPQYRVGSHRQFVLLARALAARGIPVLRFDVRGMGDASGARRDFESIEADLAAAIACFQAECPALRELVLWGLCDAASAILLNAWRHPEVSGLVLLNPWVRTEQGLARAHLRHYYLHRLFSAHLWGALLRGETRPGAALRGLVEVLIRGLGVSARAGENRPPDGPLAPHRPLPERLAEGWRRFDGARLLILSGADLTAAEFRDTARSHPAWQGLLDDPRLTLHELPEANHSFARRDWRDQVARWTGDWLLGLADAEGLP